MTNSLDQYEELLHLLDTTDENEFFIQNLLLYSIDNSLQTHSTCYYTLSGALWLVYGIFVYKNYLILKEEDFFSFFVILRDRMTSKDSLEKLVDIELKEVESFDYRKDWSIRIMTNVLAEYLNEMDLAHISQIILGIKMSYLYSISNLKNSGRLTEGFYVTGPMQIGFTPIKVLKINNDKKYFGPQVIDTLLNIPEYKFNDKQIIVLKKIEKGYKFMDEYLTNLENTFYQIKKIKNY